MRTRVLSAIRSFVAEAAECLQKSGAVPPHSKTQASSLRSISRPRFGVRRRSAALKARCEKENVVITIWYHHANEHARARRALATRAYASTLRTRSLLRHGQH